MKLDQRHYVRIASLLRRAHLGGVITLSHDDESSCVAAIFETQMLPGRRAVLLRIWKTHGSGLLDNVKLGKPQARDEELRAVLAA